MTLEIYICFVACERISVAAKHTFECSEHSGNVFKLKEYPTKENNNQRIDVREYSRKFFKYFAEEQLFEGDKYEIIKAPEHIVPACAVPETCEEPGYKQVYYGACTAFAVAAERNVYIVPEERAERNVPPSPEFAY